mmetsp:Transcript_22076/g.54544  ORF Transcript_22076/g.54544 Transcript_22076/m.54544 type:complete len:253 (-) Transcript_22076:1944-2702(-)
MAPAIPARAPAKAEITSPSVPTPTCTGSDPEPALALTSPVIPFEITSKARNLGMAKASSREAVGGKPANSGSRSLAFRSLQNESVSSSGPFVLVPLPFSCKNSFSTSVHAFDSTSPMLRTLRSSNGAAAALVITVAAVAASKRMTSEFETPPSEKKVSVKERRKSSVAPNPKEPNISDARKVISALWKRAGVPLNAMTLFIRSPVPISIPSDSVSSDESVAAFPFVGSSSAFAVALSRFIFSSANWKSSSSF